jgi:hypothetical protein
MPYVTRLTLEHGKTELNISSQTCVTRLNQYYVTRLTLEQDNC